MASRPVNPLLRLVQQPIFIDTGGWQAVLMESDQHHQLARSAWEQLLEPLVTTNQVVGETYTLLHSRHGYDPAWNFLSVVERTRRLARHHVTPEMEAQAYVILRQYRDHDFRFVDATSFAFMRSAGITEAFAFDVHFAAAGFTRIPSTDCSPDILRTGDGGTPFTPALSPEGRGGLAPLLYFRR